MVYRDLFGCSTVKNKGTCSNRVRIGRQELEARILGAMRGKLMGPSMFEEFCDGFTREINRIRMEASSGIAARQAALKKVERQIEQIITAIEDGMYQPSMKARMDDVEARKAVLLEELSHAEEPPALLHPSMARKYHRRIGGLFQALDDEKTRLEASDDTQALVGRIIVSPGKGDQISLWLEGDLAGILTLAADKKTPANPEEGRVLTSMVAGARNHRQQQGLFQSVV